MRPVRILLACLLAALAFPAFAAPDEELLGKAKGYPLGTRANWFFDEGVRVGSFSHLDEILPHYTLSKAAVCRCRLPRPQARSSSATGSKTRPGRSRIFWRTSASPGCW